jgi:predicted phage terminase large subunit-like protein
VQQTENIDKETIALSILETGEFEKSLIKEIHSDSYYEFYKQAYKVILPGEHFSDNWHIKYICDELQEELRRIQRREVRQKDVIINIPFRSSKSLICTVVFNAWCWTQDQSIKLICTSYSASLALEHALACRSLIMSEWYQNLYGDIVILEDDQNAAGFYKIKGGGFRKSVGMGGQITGSGADIIIVDDPQNPKMAASEVERKNVKSFYDTTLYSRLNQPELGVRVVVMQRLAEDDLSGHLIATSPEKHKHICMPVQVNMEKLEKENISPKSLLKFYSKEGLFWPDRFTDSVIQDFIKRLGSKEAAGQLYQRPAPMEGNMVKEEWFDIIDPKDIVRDVRDHPMFFIIDTAESEEQQENGDSTAILTGFKKDNCLYICNIIKVKKAFYELVKFIPVHVMENLYSQYSRIKIEPKSSGKSVVSQLRATTQLNVSELPPPTDSKVVRLSSITPTLESRRVKLVNGAYLHSFMPNLLMFPNAKHDDDVDVFIHAVESELTNEGFDFMFA